MSILPPRAFGARTFDEEKKLFIAQGRFLCSKAHHTSLQTAKAIKSEREFHAAFKGASAELRGDRAAALAAVSAAGVLLEFCSDDLKDDAEVVSTAVDSFLGALRYASERLRGDREIVLRAVRKHGTALAWVGEQLYQDQEVMAEACKTYGNALEYASEELRGEKSLVLAAARCFSQALRYASEALQSDEEVVIAALQTEACDLCLWSKVFRHTSPELKRDKEFMLSAIRATSFRLAPGDFWEEADEDLRRSIALGEFGQVAESAIARPGDAAPVLSIALSVSEQQSLDNTAGESTKNDLPSVSCIVSLLSGASFLCEIPDIFLLERGLEGALSSSDADCNPASKRARLGSTSPLSPHGLLARYSVGDLARAVLPKIPVHSQVEKPERVFMVFVDAKGESVSMTPWDCNRSLAEFLHT